MGYSYDIHGRLTQITYPSGKILSLGYDASGRTSSLQADGQTIVEQLSYHPFGPVTGWTWGDGTLHTRSLDLDWRISAYPLGGVTHSGRTEGTTQNYTYDPAGNLIADGAHTYTYDARGRMVQSTTGALTTSYRYNGLRPRVSKTASGSSAVSRRFVYDEAGHLIDEYDGSAAPIQEMVYLGDLPIAVLSETDGIHYVHADQINTPWVITDSQGVVVWRWASDPFGVGAPDQDADVDGLGFVDNRRMAGQYSDSETDLHYNYFRDYDPAIGRYVESDPIGLSGGINTYGYVGQNPVQFDDPFGLKVRACCRKIPVARLPPLLYRERRRRDTDHLRVSRRYVVGRVGCDRQHLSEQRVRFDWRLWTLER